jgi:catalase-peroxidase
VPVLGRRRASTPWPNAPSNADWWPNQLNLAILHQQSSKSDPMGEAFDYAEEFRRSTWTR